MEALDFLDFMPTVTLFELFDWCTNRSGFCQNREANRHKMRYYYCKHSCNRIMGHCTRYPSWCNKQRKPVRRFNRCSSSTRAAWYEIHMSKRVWKCHVYVVKQTNESVGFASKKRVSQCWKRLTRTRWQNEETITSMTVSLPRPSADSASTLKTDSFYFHKLMSHKTFTNGTN